MPAPKNNHFWKERKKHGRDRIFNDPQILGDAANEYFQWVEENPLKEQKAVQYQGAFIYGEVNKMRAMTITGLCLFLNIDFTTWQLYKKRKDFIHITSRIEGIIYDQKFTGAAANLLNANIIARDLGLTNKKGYEITANVTAEDLTDEELASIALSNSVEITDEEAVSAYMAMIKGHS